MSPYQKVIAVLNNSIGGAQANIGAHGAFWRGLTRNQFVAMKIYSLAVVEPGRGAQSNLIKALKGEAPFGADLPNPPAGARWPRMPDGFPPVSNPDISFIEEWINDGCPENEIRPATEFTWTKTGAPTASSRYDDVWFRDPTIGWAVNSNGQILHTRDGGRTWREQLHDGSVYLRCIAFPSLSKGWVGSITEGKTLYSTIDGGANWTLVRDLPIDAPIAVCGIWAVNEMVVYAAGANYPEMPVRMMKTIDGGTSWSAWDMRPWADNLIDVYFPTERRGWVVGGITDNPREATPSKPKLRPVVLHTEDGGITWTDQVASIRGQFPLGEWGWKIQFLNEQVGFISLQNYEAGAILTTIDGGASWTRRPINDPQMNANLEGIGFIDTDQGWVGGWGDRPKQKRTSSATTDGGATWWDANDIGRTINRFRFIGEPINVGYAAGETIYRYSSGERPMASATISSSLTEQTNRLLESSEFLEASGSAEIAFSVPPGASRLTVRAFDPDGPFTRVLLDEKHPAAGRRTVLWHGVDDAGLALPRWSHVLRLTIDDVSESRLILLTGEA